MGTVKHQEEYRVRSYEVDAGGHATLPVIANYFQEAAGKNARDLNFDIGDLHKNGLTWVLYRMHIRIDRFPSRWQHVVVNTWPSSGDGIRAFRDYELMSESGDVLGVGISQWMVLNIDTRRPTRIPKEILDMGLEVEKHMLPTDKITFPEMEEADRSVSYIVSRNDLDMNQHVNNVTYIEWMTGFMPDDLPIDSQCDEINIQYHHECGLNQEIEISCQSLDNNKYLHQITTTEGTMLAQGISGWSS